MRLKQPDIASVEFIFGNSNKRFSGVTSTLLQLLPCLVERADVAVLGQHHLPQSMPYLSFFDAARWLHVPRSGNRLRVFHARRNDEMLQALVLKHLFRAKIKIIFTSTAQRKKSWLTRWLMRQMDALLSTSTTAAAYMPEPPEAIIPHGIDVAQYSSKGASTSQLSLPGQFNIGLFGRVRAQKGVDYLIDAALPLLQQNNQWGLVFVGEITAAQKSFVALQKQKLVEAGVEQQVTFTGRLPFAKLPAYFQQVDLVCALSKNEGFGLTVLEAAAAGKPVIATKAGAWPDILSQREIGFLVDSGDLTALRAALAELMSNAARRRQLGDNAYRLACEKYRIEDEAKQLVSFYRSLLQRDPLSPQQ